MADHDVPDGALPDGGDVADGGGVADEIVAFWETARAHAKIGRLPVVTGVGVTAAVPPPAWAFGDSPELADELLALVLAGVKTATATSVAELEAAGEPIPRVGDLSIVLDGAGHPRALLRTTEVRRARFGDVDEDFAASEGEDDRTLASWRREHLKYFGRVLAGTGTPVDDDLEVVLETFEVVYPRLPKAAGRRR